MERKANMPSTKGRRLLLFPAPLQGHINPMIQLANLLHRRGFSITIIHTKFNSPDISKYPHFTFRFISDGLSEAEASTSDLVVLFQRLLTNCVEPFRKCFSNLLLSDSDAHEEEPVACLITDTTWYFTQELADRFNLPRIAFRTSSVCSFLAFDALPLLRDKGYLPKKESELETRVEEFPTLKVKDIPEITTSHPEDLCCITGEMMEMTKLASGLIFNSFRELEEQELNELGKKFSMPTFTIGPLHKYFRASSSSLLEEDQSAISWLDSQAPKSVIFVSFGSIAEMNGAALVEVAWGIANSMQPFLWVIRPGLVQDSQQLPTGFLEATNGRGYIVGWAPQVEVLAHPAVGCFWTHSGWNSTLESLSEGIPMICSPFFGDQMVNSRYVSDVWRTGVKLEKGLERGEIERAIRKLMVDKEGEKIRDQVMSVKNKVDSCLKPGGSSCESLDSFLDYISSF